MNHQPLPPYRGILAVDTVGYTTNDDAYLRELSTAVPSLLEKALAGCGFEERLYEQGTGDGYFYVVLTKDLPMLVHPFLGTLQSVLEEYDGPLRALHRGLRLRLRVSINVGPVPNGRNPASRAVNETFRLLDSTPVKERMLQSSPDVTMLAAILSDRVYEDVVVGGFTGLHTAEFERVTAAVVGKNFTQPAWLHVPRHSATVGAPHPNAVDVVEPAQAAPAAGGVNHGQIINAHRVSGGVNQDRRS